jgi:hypothetical protein
MRALRLRWRRTVTIKPGGDLPFFVTNPAAAPESHRKDRLNQQFLTYVATEQHCDENTT